MCHPYVVSSFLIWSITNPPRTVFRWSICTRFAWCYRITWVFFEIRFIISIFSSIYT
nr:MAG TPA: hypothetical protein [Caudoviricetes sp.]